jgi:probable DNA metabolism protein
VAAAFEARVEPGWELAAWRRVARHALAAGLAPDRIHWNDGLQDALFGAVEPAEAASNSTSASISTSMQARVPPAFIALAEAVLCHRDAERHALLYRVLWRLASGERGLLGRATDPDVHRLRLLEKAVRRDVHKMKAFVRFRAVDPGAPGFLAWFEPDHWILDRVAPFFLRRFAGMHWAILTPYRRVAWDGDALAFGAGGRRDEIPGDDAQEALWRTYYSHIFNPARANPRMMQSEMPRKYWRHLPEAALIPDLLRSAAGRVDAMRDRDAEPPRRRLPGRTRPPRA